MYDNNIYILYSCDNLKSPDTMSIIGIFSSFENLKVAIKDELQEAKMYLNKNINLIKDHHELNQWLEYGHIEAYQPNRRIT